MLHVGRIDRRIDALRDDALGAEPAGVLEHQGALLGEVLIEQEPALVPRSSRVNAALRSRKGSARRSSPWGHTLAMKRLSNPEAI
jgi:hypothetical protein